MFKNKQKYFLISVLLMILFLAASGTAFGVDLNENLEVLEVSVCKDNLENSQNDIVGSSEITLNGGKFSDIQKAIDDIDNGGTIHLNGYYSAQNKDSHVYVNKNINIVGGSDTVLDGKNISCIFSIQKTGSNCQISNLKFVNGMSGHGGAMIVLGKNVVIKDSVFENNYADYAGAAIYVCSIFNDSGKYPEEGENLIIKNCNFTNNFAQVAAGAIGVYGNNTKVIGCNFVSNKVKPTSNHEAYGGAIQIGRDEYNLCSYVVNCSFINNGAIGRNLNNSHGGAGCVRAGIIYQNCKFINNSAGQGGALTYHASGSIEDCVFINNSAKLYGGALSTGYMDMDMDLKVINCNFEQNNAPYGGAVQLKGKNIKIHKSIFNKNIAAINGGAINIIAKTVTVDDVEFNKNIANVNGGAIYINGDKTTIVDSSFIANEAIPDAKKLDDGLGGAIYVNSSSATINKNIFNNNIARNGSAIYYDKSGLNCVISDNAMAENQAWVYALPICAKNIYYGDDCEVSATIFGGNNIAKYNDLFVSNAIYNNAKQDKIKVNGETPILGAVDNGKLYQDSREYNMDILLTVTHEDGSVAFNKTLKSDFKGQVSNILKNLKPGRYKVSATHFEDTYYKYIANVTYFSVFPKADLQLNKSSNGIDVNYGDIVIWTLKITNNGPNIGTGIRLKDLISEGLIILSCDDENYDKKTGILNIDSLNIGESKIINIKTLVNKTGTFINEASVSGNEYDWNLKNNNDSASLNVNPSADLAIEILVNDTNPKFNSLVKWTLRVTNNGPDEATGVVVCDLLSKDLIYLSSTGNYDVKSGLWNIETLESGKSVSIDIVTLVNKTGKIANDASVSGKEYDWNLSNNYDNKSIAVDVCADLAIKKLVNDTNPKFNSLVEWTLRVTNNGPDTATGVVVCDILPEGLISIDKSFNGTWNVGKLLNNQTKELTIICLVNKTGKLVNIADIAGNEYDCNLTNNIVNKSIEVAQSADLFVKKYEYNTLPEKDKANELLWTQEYAPGTNYYGRPPIVGSLAAVAGDLSRARYNNSFFKNYGMPTFAVTITGDFADYEKDPEDEDYDPTKTLKYQINQQLQQVIRNPHSAMCITIPSEGEEGNVDINIQPLSVEQREADFRLFRTDNRDEVIHAHRVDPSRIGIYDSGNLNGSSAKQTDKAYTVSTIAPIKAENEYDINTLLKNEFDLTDWKFVLSDMDPKDFTRDIDVIEKLFNMASITPNQIIKLVGDKFGLSQVTDNAYLDEYYLNGVPLDQVWQQAAQNNTEYADSVLGVLNDEIVGEATNYDETKEESGEDGLDVKYSTKADTTFSDKIRRIITSRIKT